MRRSSIATRSHKPLREPQALISVLTPNRKPGSSTPTARFGVSDLSSRYSERCREVVGGNRLWLRGQVWLTGIEIDRDRDVFVDHQPIAVDILVNVCHAYGQIQLLALLIGASDALDAVAVGKIVVGGDVEVGQLESDRAVEAVEKILPVLAVGCCSDILPRRLYVEDKQGLVRNVDLHDRVEILCLDGGDEAVF